MKVVQEGSIYQLTFLPRFFPVNCYIVEEEKDLTLIDTALPYSTTGILKVAQAIGKPIKRILLTHAHQDHVGSLDALKLHLPEAQVYISKRDARLLAGDRSLDPHERPYPIKGGVPKKILTKPDVLLEDGDRIQSLLALATPGHTPGSMSFLDTRNQALLAGDAFQVRGGLAVSGDLRLLFPFPAWATWNCEASLNSAYKIRDCRPTLLAAGHGSMLLEPGDKINQAILSAQNRFSKGKLKGKDLIN